MPVKDPGPRLRKLGALKDAEARGEVADSMNVRRALIARVAAGELTGEQAQAELARVKREAKRQGKTTRSRVYREG